MEYLHTGACPQPVAASMRPVIFFDWDGTLADSMGLCIQELRLTLEELGLPVPDNACLARCNGPTYEESVGILEIPDALAARFLETRLRVEVELAPVWQRLFPGIREMLAVLSQRADLVIMSNGLADYLRVSTEAMDVAQYFARIQPMIPGKTKTQALEMTLTQMCPRQAVMVGDRRGDMLAGKANGLPTIAACYGYGLPDEWALADRQAYSVEQLTQMLLADLPM